MRATGEVLWGTIKAWNPSSFPTPLSHISWWGASSPSAKVRHGLCQTLHRAGFCPKPGQSMLYVCLGYSLGLVDVDGSVPIDFIGSGGCPWLHFFNQRVWGGGRSQLTCCGQSKCMKLLWRWRCGKRGNLLPTWVVTLVNRVRFGPECGKAVGRRRESGTKSV